MSFQDRSEVYVVAYCSHKAKVAGSTPAAATVVIFIDSILKCIFYLFILLTRESREFLGTWCNR